jgi:hypothetical protein
MWKDEFYSNDFLIFIQNEKIFLFIFLMKNLLDLMIIMIKREKTSIISSWSLNKTQNILWKSSLNINILNKIIFIGWKVNYNSYWPTFRTRYAFLTMFFSSFCVQRSPNYSLYTWHNIFFSIVSYLALSLSLSLSFSFSSILLIYLSILFKYKLMQSGDRADTWRHFIRRGHLTTQLEIELGDGHILLEAPLFLLTLYKYRVLNKCLLFPHLNNISRYSICYGY